MTESELTETYAQTVQRLASAQKGAARGAPAYSIYVNRRLGRYLAAACFRARLTPNAVTAISAVFTFLGIALIALVAPSWWAGTTIALLLATGYAFDSADGQVARLRGGGSVAGEWLDHVVDCVKVTCLHLAVLISFFRFRDFSDPAFLLVPMGYTVVAVTVFFALILNDQLKTGQLKTGRDVVAEISLSEVSPRPSTLRRSLLVLPTDYGVLCLIFFTLGCPPIFFTLYSVMFALNTVHLVLALRKWFRDMVALN
ncbi:MAG: CDP-alcohol phosphatidyltransferase family protein [Microbacteriaceae bacterium]|nr:CDP-alcohol phosphatidyltransferase family protein [Microbacteriaceae bacterium]